MKMTLLQLSFMITVNNLKGDDIMVNINDFNATIEKEKAMHPESPYFERDIWLPRLAALGEDENDIIEFIDSADNDTISALISIEDDIFAKFDSEKMEKSLDKLEEKYNKIWERINGKR